MSGSAKTFIIHLHPGSSRRRLLATPDGFEVWLHAKPISGAANTELLKMLSRHLKVPTSSLTITRGLRSRIKLVSVH